MSVLFWILWVFDLLLTLFLIWASMYRESMGAFNNENLTYAVVLMLILLGSIVVRYALQWPMLSLLLATLPLLILLIMYFFDL